MQSNACSIENYIRAKDGNRPALLRQAFTAQASLEPVMDWLRDLDYPWCSAADITGRAPDIADLAPILGYIEAG